MTEENNPNKIRERRRLRKLRRIREEGREEQEEPIKDPKEEWLIMDTKEST